eukprot:gene1572-1911_t
MDEAVDITTQRMGYPSDEYLQLMHQVTQLRTTHYAICSFQQCLTTLHEMLGRQGTRLRQQDLDSMRRFFRDELYLSMERLMQFPGTGRVHMQESEDIVLDAMLLLAVVAGHMLQYRISLPAADVPADLDSDLLPLAQALLTLFNKHKHIYDHLIDQELPPMPADYEVLATSEEWAPRRFQRVDFMTAGEDEQQQDDDTEPCVEHSRWWTYLVNAFGQFKGFDHIMTLIQQPNHISFPLLNMLTAVLAQVVDDSSEYAKQQFNVAAVPVLQHVTDLVEADNDRLSDFGNDRTYNTFQCLVNTNLPRILVYGSDPQAASVQLQHVKCTFVLKMLESSSFNKLLSGVRECNTILKSLSHSKPEHEPACEDLINWMQENNIVQRILRTNLHQRQYVQEVQGIMVVLTQTQRLTPEHLDVMWAVIEKEDNYEAVKNHMFDLLAEIASHFVPSQLDMLFAKLERRPNSSVQDTSRLLGLLQHLAASDNEVRMHKKIIEMVWELTIPADTDPSLVQDGALAAVINHYLGHMPFSKLQVQDAKNLVYKMLQRCFKALLAGLGGQVPLLRSLRELLRLLPDKGEKLISQERAVDKLDGELSFHTKLVDAICRLVDNAHQAVDNAMVDISLQRQAADDANPLQAVDPSQQQAVKDIRAAAIEQAVAIAGEGPWSYYDVLREHMLTLKTFAGASGNYFLLELAEQLWDKLLANPACAEDQQSAVQTFFRNGFLNEVLFDSSTQCQLLVKHMVKLDAVAVPHSAAKLYLDIFHSVNKNSHTLKQVQMKSGAFRYVAEPGKLESIAGLDFLWQMYLRNPDERVASLTKLQLLNLYHCHSLHAPMAAPIRKALVQRLVDALRQAAPALVSSQDPLAARVILRCLSLASAAVRIKELSAMPPVPAHCLAWRGTPLALEIQRDGASRIRLISHSNEYVGLLRERLAQQVGCNAKNVRMFYSGHELNNDASTLAPLDIRNRTVLLCQVSLEPNKFSMSPAEYKPLYETTSLSWMLSQADGLYPLLLKFIDVRGVGEELPMLALDLLATDLKLRRQLSELLVMLLHNLIDAAQGWANQAAAGSWDMMSGAESGAGAGAVTTAAAAGESGVASMAAVGGAISSKDSQQAEPDPQQQQDAASPSMEDAASSPAQPLAAPLRLAQPQAQQPKPGSGKQQRHRAVELPPLPPVAGLAATQGGTAATCQQGLALVFGAHTLRLMASTLLAAAELLERLVTSDSNPKLLPWLLMQLAVARPTAQQLPCSSQEFYELLSSMIGKLCASGSSWGHLPQQLFAMANQMLDEEVENLKALAVATTAVTVSEDASAADAACMLLQGRLQLVLALVRALDRRGIGSDSQGGLIKLLLQDFLYPEAMQLTGAADALDLPKCAASLDPRCSTASCRKAALELLAELMGDTPASLEEGVSLLIELHYQHPVLTDWSHTPRLLRLPGQFVGLKNGGATCYMNAGLKKACAGASVWSLLITDGVQHRDSSHCLLECGGLHLFAQMAIGRGMYVLPRSFWHAFKDYDGTPIDVKEHQDAYEFFTRLQDLVDQHLISTGQLPAIKPVMGGVFVQQIICRGVDYTSEREEDFYQISVDVKGMGSLEKSLDDYVKGELMEGDNAYLCEELGRRVPAVKRAAIKHLPQMLCVHLKRFEFDYHNMTRYKVRDRFEFPLEIDMFKYTAEGLAAMDREQKAAEQQAKQQSSESSAASRQHKETLQQQAKAGNAAAGCEMYDLMGVVVTRWDVSGLEPDCFGGKASQDYENRGTRPPRGEYERPHSAVMRTNIDYAWQQHVLDKDYFRFVRQLVDSRGDLGQLAARKSRSPGRPQPAAAAAGMAANGINSLSVNPHGDPQLSPGPSSRRGEEAEAVAQALMRLGILFQFQVYMRASESLRSEGNIWKEALTSLMGSGPSSTSCLQVFLQLLLTHPSWLHDYLLESPSESVSSPRRWAVELLGWVVEAAAKGCSRVLAPFTATRLRKAQQQGSCIASAEMSDDLPLVACDLLDVINCLARLARTCLPSKQSQPMMDLPEVPCDVARVLIRFAAVGPWAAAHLMQVVNIVPDLAAIISCAVQAAEPDMELLMDDVTPLYCLLAEMLQYAANLPQLSAEWDTATTQHQQQNADNPYLKLRVVGSPAADVVTAIQQGEDGVLALLPPQAFSSLMDDQLVKGLAYPSCAQFSNVLLLAGLLSWNNSKVSEAVLRAGATSLWRLVNMNELHHSKTWELAARNLSLMMLQPDKHLTQRIVFWLTGQLRRLHSQADTPKPICPGLASFQQPISWHTVAFFRLVQLLLQHCKENPAGPPDLATLRLQVASATGVPAETNSETVSPATLKVKKQLLARRLMTSALVKTAVPTGGSISWDTSAMKVISSEQRLSIK